MGNLRLILATALMGLFMIISAEARVSIDVDLSTQSMAVTSQSGSYVWPISSARSGFSTPRGRYNVVRMETMHRSRKYHNSPMPHSLFFKGGYAIHGTYSIAALGQPASHGCIRLAPQNAAALYQMVRQEGARIAINGTPPTMPRYYAASASRPSVVDPTAARYVRTVHGTMVYASGAQSRHRFAQPAYAAGDRGFYLRSTMSYAPQPRGLGEWLTDPGGW